MSRVTRDISPFDKLIIKLLKLCGNSQYFTFMPRGAVVTYKDII